MNSKEEPVDSPNKSSGAGKVWNILASLLFLTAIFNVGWLVYLGMNRPPAVIQEGDFSIFINPNAQFAFLKTRIAVALIISALGLLLGRLKGLVISAFFLCWIIVEYVIWWVKSFSTVQESANLAFSKVDHVAFLLHGNWWDIWVLLIVVVVLISEIAMMRAFRGESYPQPVFFK